MPAFVGTTGNDVRNGTADADIFRLRQGGSDTAAGGGGDDRFMLGGALDTLDVIRGGAGDDVLSLEGDYSAGLVFGATTMTNIETLRLSGAFDYDLTLDDANVAAGARLVVNARQVLWNSPSGSDFVFDGSAETDGRFTIHGTAGDDNIAGGAGDDTFNLGQGLSNLDVVSGGGGNDTFKLGIAMQVGLLDGGDGFDTVTVSGQVGPETWTGAFVSVERLVVVRDEHVNVWVHNESIAAGATLEIDGTAVLHDWFSIEGYDETDGHIHARGGGGSGILGGGQLADLFVMTPHTDTYYLSGYLGADRIVCSTGEERLDYWGGAQSTGVAGHDRVRGFNADEDGFHFDFDLAGGFDGTAVDAAVNKATFDADLSAASSDNIGPNGAWIVHASGGSLAGHDFLCVDADGDAAYTAGADYVIDITGYTGTLDASDFI